MGYVISKRFDFAASHVLKNLREGHPCTRLHGHNYKVTIYLKSEKLNEADFVLDYREMDVVKKWIDAKLDHKHLNDVFVEMGWVSGKLVKEPLNPSAENIAHLLFYFFKYELGIPQLFKVCVKESEKTEACYEE